MVHQKTTLIYIRTKTWNISVDSVVVIKRCNSMIREFFRTAAKYKEAARGKSRKKKKKKKKPT